MIETLLISGATCLLTLVITSIFNWVMHSPKRKKIERQKQEQQRASDKEAILAEIHSLEDKLNVKFEKQEGHMIDVRKGLQSVLKNDLKVRYDSWIRKGYAPPDSKDDLERMYQVYHNLWQNGVMDARREKFLALPDSKEHKNEEE